MVSISVFIAKTRTSNLKSAVRYADKDRRAENNFSLCRGVNCSDFAVIALEQMRETKRIYGKEGGRECKHYVLSFAPGEITQDAAIEYAEKLAYRCFGDRFQAFVGLHTRSESRVLHAHIIVNSVSHLDGYKIQLHKRDLEYFKDINDELAREYGLQVIDRSPEAVAKRGLPQLYSMASYQLHKKEFFASDNGKNSYVGNCYYSVVNCMELEPKSFDEFSRLMGNCSWKVKLRGKNITFTSKSNPNHRIRANRLAKIYNDDLVSTAGILFVSNSEFWQDCIMNSKQTRYNRNSEQFITKKMPKNITLKLNDLSSMLHVEDQPRPNKMKLRLSSRERDDYDIDI